MSATRKIVSVATIEPDNIAILDDLRFMLQVDEVQPLLADPAESLEAAIEKYYPKTPTTPTASPILSIRTKMAMATIRTLATIRLKMSMKWISPAWGSG